ncbi:hypothetical protein ACHAXA_000233 [Cyclostephanos tholiformis]|uniref:Plant heme peroxidase family profile domain-containing protein n=1 Tax=Cyclostephanos tholiformis TaxID=382380 RepID=A0ABD3R4Z7_9STRA
MPTSSYYRVVILAAGVAACSILAEPSSTGRQLEEMDGWGEHEWPAAEPEPEPSGKSGKGSKGSKSGCGSGKSGKSSCVEPKPEWTGIWAHEEVLSGKSGKGSKRSKSSKGSKSGSAEPEPEPHWGWPAPVWHEPESEPSGKSGKGTKSSKSTKSGSAEPEQEPHWGWPEPSGKSGKGSKSSKSSKSTKGSKSTSGEWVFVWAPVNEDAWGWPEPESSGKSGKGSKGSKSGSCSSGKSGKSGCLEPYPEWPAWDETAWNEPKEEDVIWSAGGSLAGWNSDGWDSDGHFKNDINYVRAEVSKLIKDSERELIPKFLRLGFHDCVGGCDGCVDMTNPDNKGLQEPIDAIYPVVTKFKDSYSRADIWAMATLVSADLAVVDGRPHGLHFPMRYIGRTDCEGADAKGVGGPDVKLPTNDLTTHELLAFFKDNFDMDMEETVTIMGVHAVATAHRKDSGFGNVGKEDGWVYDAHDYILNNRYYNMLVGDDMTWDLELVHNEDGVPSRYQWYQNKEGEDERPIMTNSDMALARDLSGYMNTDKDGNEGAVSCVYKAEEAESGVSTYTRRRSVQSKPVVCPVADDTVAIMHEYKMDNELFLIDFEHVLEKMLKSGYDGGRKLTRLDP